MMRTAKILSLAVGGIIALIIVLLLAVWLLVNPNDYKGRIAAAVKQSTGRELILKGDLKLSVFPWVALELGPASLGNPPGFGEEPFLAFNHAAVRVSLMGLLHKRLTINRIDIDGLDVRLRKNAQGTGNWQDFGQERATDKKAPAESNGGLPLELEGIKVSNGRVSYPGLDVQKFNLDVGAYSGHGVTPIGIAFEANRGVPDENVSVNAKFELGMDSRDKPVHLAAVNLSGLVSQPGDGRPVHWEMTAASIDVDSKAQTLAAPAFTMSYSGAKITGSLQATKFIDDLSLTGSVTLAPLVLHEFAPRLGVTLPKTKDPRALKELSASTDLSYGAAGLRLEKLQAQLDDTTLKGTLSFAGEPRGVKFELAVDQVDADRYLSPQEPAAGAAAPPKPEKSATAAQASKSPDVNGTLTLGSVHFSPLDFSNVRVTLASKDGVTHLFPAQAQIDGGSYSGNITLDQRAAPATLSLDEHLSGVDMARLMAGTKYKGKLSGRGNVNLKATARGTELPAFMQSLTGHFDANIADGALEGMDLAYESALAQALIKRESPPPKSSPARTKFEAFKMSAEITNGVARTSDLTIATPVVRVTGQGSANLPTKAIDFKMVASVLKSPGVSLADIPLNVTGTYMDPTIRPDVEALAKGQLKQKLQDVLKKNGLESLFK